MKPPRERDERGRPRNARPRDSLGRPLPRGSQGLPVVPDETALDGEDTLQLAQHRLDAGLPFHAHEILESRWKSAPADERDLWQGLTLLAVGLTHALRGNRRGARAVLTRARDRLATCTVDPPYAIDVRRLMAWAEAVLVELDHDPERALPNLRLR